MANYIPHAYFAKIALKTGSINKACKYISRQLNHQWRPITIYNVFSGHNKPSDELIYKLNSLARPAKKRYRLKIEAQSKEQFEAWKKIPMGKRIKALNKLSRFTEKKNENP